MFSSDPSATSPMMPITDEEVIALATEMRMTLRGRSVTLLAGCLHLLRGPKVRRELELVLVGLLDDIYLQGTPFMTRIKAVLAYALIRDAGLHALNVELEAENRRLKAENACLVEEMRLRRMLEAPPSVIDTPLNQPK